MKEMVLWDTEELDIGSTNATAEQQSFHTNFD